MDKILNYIKIDDFISTSGQPKEHEFELIAKEGFEVVINLALCDSSNALENEDKIVTSYKMSYLHLPVDWEAPEKERLELFLQLLSNLRANGKKVYVHCALNYRASVFIYHYKKTILKDANATLNAPKEFEPSLAWKEFIALHVSF